MHQNTAFHNPQLYRVQNQSFWKYYSIIQQLHFAMNLSMIFLFVLLCQIMYFEMGSGGGCVYVFWLFVQGKLCLTENSLSDWI